MSEKARILVADDDKAIRLVLEQFLIDAGFAVEMAANAGELWAAVQAGTQDVVITDVLMPDENGLDILPKILKHRPNLPVIVMSAQNTLSTAVKATERGAFDYLAKPFDLEDLGRTIGTALAKTRPPSTNDENDDSVNGEESALIGRSSVMQDLFRAMARLMATDLTVLITGESGTGKELVARALHSMGPRKERPFVAVNMAAIPHELVESDLFGHEKGAFTGATTRTKGRFEQASGGTLFLDEIGDMPLEAQTRLLRVLQEGEFTTVGGTRPISVDVRIIAATNKDLRHEVAEKRFREDLFYRLNVVPLSVPPLRARLSDIGDLVSGFCQRAQEKGLPRKVFSDGALDRLKQYHWPGNVRELENLVQRLCALAVEDRISADAVDQALSHPIQKEATEHQTPRGLREALECHLKRYFDAHGEALPPPGLHGRVLREMEKPLISLALDSTGGNQLKAAELLGLNRNTLRKKIRSLGLHNPRAPRK